MSHDPSEIIPICWFAAQKNVSSYDYQYWKQLLCLIFLFKSWYIYFRILGWIWSLKEQHLFEMKIFCNIKNVFTVTFDQFNASMLKKSSISPPPQKTNKKNWLLSGSVLSYKTIKCIAISKDYTFSLWCRLKLASTNKLAVMKLKVFKAVRSSSKRSSITALMIITDYFWNMALLPLVTPTV